jgi:HYR domain-containing protein
MLGKVLAVAAAITLVVTPTSLAATKDTASAEASPGPYFVGEPITFTSTTPCTTACGLTWTYLSGTRLGERVGVGEKVSKTFSTPGLKTVQLKLTELCVGSPRLTCASFAYVSVNVERVATPVDTTAPTFTASGLTAEATGADTVVNYTFEATDPDDDVASQSCTPEPGSAFPVGSTPIDCTAIDSNGNVGTQTFSVVVTDTTAPELTVPPTTTNEATSPDGATVDFAVSAKDLVDGGLTPSCSWQSGATFPVGSTTVDCTVSDAHTNTSSKSFVVVVTDTTAPELTVPPATTKEATSPAGAAIDFTVSATDLVDGALTPSCSWTSGSTFPVGSTTVDCTVSDAHTNTSNKSFVVVVTDTTAPTLTVPGPITVDATSPAGAVVMFTASANDLVDGTVAPSCSTASGATFPIGTTTVSCTATDSHGNTSAVSTFTVRVDGAAPQLADVLQVVQRWSVRGRSVAEALREVIAEIAQRPRRTCDTLGDFDRALRGSLGRRLTAEQLAWLRGQIDQIENVLGCSSAPRDRQR